MGYIRSDLLETDQSFDLDSDLFAVGLDSMWIMQLVLFVEEEFAVKLPDRSMARRLGHGRGGGCLVATGATLQTLLAAWLTGCFLLLGGPLACLVVPTFGSVWRRCTASGGSRRQIWCRSGSPGGPSDALGVLLFAPLGLLAWPGARSFSAGNAVRIALPLLVTACCWRLPDTNGIAWSEARRGRRHAA